MEIYRRTQHSPLWIAVVAAMILVVVVTAAVTASEGGDVVALIVAAFAFVIVAIVVVAFSRLTVVVEEARIRLAFGFGWPAKTIELADVAAVAAVRNRWWYGYGIRKIPRGWMWNVWGLDAVEVRLRSGKTFRIGTDQPDELLDALTGRVASF